MDSVAGGSRKWLFIKVIDYLEEMAGEKQKII